MSAKSGVQLIAAERQRQIEQKCWSAKHDDSHDRGELLDAGLSYIFAAINDANDTLRNSPPGEWPWSWESWKPEDLITNLAKAGALIAAEIDRIQRMREIQRGG